MTTAASCHHRLISHVLFDMDGLLLDTEKFYTVVQEQILADYGKKFDWNLKAKMMGKKALEAGKILVQQTGLDGILSPEDFIKRREMMLHDMFPDSDLMPGVERLIRHLHAHNVPMAVATRYILMLCGISLVKLLKHFMIMCLELKYKCLLRSSQRQHFELKTTKHGPIFALMHHIVVGDDPAVVHGKPSPDIFLVAAQRFEDPDLKLANVLVFEDAPSGVAAARTAGMQVVMVPDPNLDPSLCQEADEVLSSLLEFDPCSWGLPPFAPISSSS